MCSRRDYLSMHAKTTTSITIPFFGTTFIRVCEYNMYNFHDIATPMKTCQIYIVVEGTEQLEFWMSG